MARVDIPTLECDRCHKQTQSKREMADWMSLTRNTVSETEPYDLCPPCGASFFAFMRGDNIPFKPIHTN